MSTRAPDNPAPICPFCGHHRATSDGDRCPHCKMRDNPTTRAATTARLGPWYVWQARNPAAPGMNFATLVSLVAKGQVTPDTVVRGPTTQQLWTRAARTKGLSREFGICYECGASLDGSSNLCPSCKRIQDPPLNPDALIDPRPREQQPAAPAVIAPPDIPPAALAEQLALPTGIREPLPAVAAAKSAAEAPATGQRILSPKELAAAFALPEANALPAEVPASKSNAPRRRRFTAGNVLLTALVLLTLGLVAYTLFNPEARAQAQTRLADLRTWAEAHMTKPEVSHPAHPTPDTAIEEPPRATPAEPPAQPASHHEEPAATAPALVPPTTEPAPPQPQPQPTVQIGPPVDPPKPLVQQRKPRRPIPAPPVVEKKQPAPPPPVAQSVPPPTTDPVATQADIDRAIDLYRQALESESAGDYAAAVKAYESIRQLPRPAWPATLDRRLSAARLRAGEG